MITFVSVVFLIIVLGIRFYNLQKRDPNLTLLEYLTEKHTIVRRIK